MRDCTSFYIDGSWIAPKISRSLDVIDPATEQVSGHISLGAAADVDAAARAARRAFASYGSSDVQTRRNLLSGIIECYRARYADMASAITEEMGAPVTLSQNGQAAMGLRHLETALSVLETYPFVEDRGSTRLTREPIGVCGLITPWNWPINQITTKVAPALATGCTIVLKPSELAPYSAVIFPEILHEAGVPPGVFNLVNGDGPTVGGAICTHPEIDMVSFTGSTRAGIEVARAAAPGVKRVCQELGGKSANIILDDAELDKAVANGVAAVMRNSGQTCSAPTRMMVPAALLERAVEIARAATMKLTVGSPHSGADIGPVVSETQWDRIQSFIESGIQEGARIVSGGLGRPRGLDRGYYVRPTVFADVMPTMTIAREEIFGPVLSILAYGTIDEAIETANATEYGLAAYVSGGDARRTRQVASRLRAGQVNINSAPADLSAPFGGFRKSGNGREWGAHAFDEYVELKATIGFGAA